MKSRVLTVTVALAAALYLAGCGHGIRFIGIDAFGKQISKRVPSSIYEKKLSKELYKVHTAATNAFNKIEEKRAPHWRLKTIGVGLGIEGKVGFFDIVSVSAVPRVRMWFNR